jgi:hypothetical protein
MRPASPLLAKALLLFVASVAAGTAAAANNSAASDAAKRPSNSFNLYVPQSPIAGTVVLPTQGVGIASNKVVITDPYKVPLIQNAGPLTPGR